MKPILIAQISPAGSTKEIAGILASAFEETGRPAQIVDLVSDDRLDDYAAVVVAAPIHGMKWLPEAAAWVAAHREGLKSRPAALVAVSYLYFAGRTTWKGTIDRGLEAVRKPLPHASVQVFGGRLPGPLPAPARWLFGVKKDRPLDLVEPAAVTAWAREWVKTVR